LHGKEGEGFNLLHECFLIPFELELHVNFAVVKSVLLPEVVLINQCNCFEVLFGKLALSRSALLLLHEVDAE
jgi:hypothetical protein